MTHYDFDNCSDRRSTDATKYRKLEMIYGRDDLTSMWIADMDFEVAPAISDALKARIDHPVYGYAMIPDDFFPSILDWLDHRHGFKASREEITFVQGVVRALGYLVNRLTQEGDAIVIQPPVYHPFRNIVVGNGRRCVTNPLVELPDGNYRMDLDHLEQVIATEHPRLMILCNPHNPIGLQWDESTLRRVAQICRQHNVIVISDEIHGDLMLGGRRHIPYLSVSDDARATGIMVGAPSKTFNIAGVESSWIIIKDPQLRDRVFPWMEVNEFSSPTFASTIATVAAYRHGEQWLDQALAYMQDNIDLLAQELPKVSGGRIKVVKPEASFLVWLDCRGLGLGHDQLVDFIVNGARLALNDGAMFGPEGDGFMRLNVGCPRSHIRLAIDSLSQACASLSR